MFELTFRRRTTRRASRRDRWVLACGVAAVLLLAASCGGDDAPATEPQPPTNGPQEDPEASEIATDFLEAAYGTFDADAAMAYVADDAELDLVGLDEKSTEGLRLLLSFWEAIGYEQAITGCEENGVSTTGTDVRCAFDFHAIRSNEIGLGPYTGSAFDVTVNDGKVVAISQTFALEEFSLEVWEPFAAWVSSEHPDDFDGMYTDSGSDFLLSEESIRLWERRTREYVDELAG